MPGALYCGDNLHVLREFVTTGSVDLVYLDPPFNSRRNYNLIYKGSKAQELAFKDYWLWSEAASTYHELVSGGEATRPVRILLKALHEVLIEADSDLLAYLSMMTVRLLELHRVLKSTGSLFLHCDPTASHYLKAILDAVFGKENFVNEVVWKRTAAKGLQTVRLANNHDVILFYRRSEGATWCADEAFAPYDLSDLDEKTLRKYCHQDEDGRRYQLTSLINPNPDRPNLTYEFLGVTRVWRWTEDRMQQAYEAGLVVQTRPGAVPRQKRYLDEQRGKPLGDVWTDIGPLNSQSFERRNVGYPTQKPTRLLERLVRMASNAGDVVLDPFCGCGTTIEACELLQRRWIGIDISHKAIQVTVEQRLAELAYESPDVRWWPVDEAAAALAAKEAPLQFQHWAVRALGGAPNPGKDRGVDGYIKVRDGDRTYRVIISVKGGKLAPTYVRDLRGTIERESAIGVLFSLRKPSKEMRVEAQRAGFIEGETGPIPRLQLITVADYFNDVTHGRVQFRGKNITPKPESYSTAMLQQQLSLSLGTVKTRPKKAKARAKSG